MHENQLESEVIQASSTRGSNRKPHIFPTTRSRVVVFDIDNTLCKSGISIQQLELARENHPECPTIQYVHKEEVYTSVYPHVFLPYLRILFDYLLDQDVRIVFFSAGAKERNTAVIPELLTSFWSKEKYEVLKSAGQFDIFSRESMRLRHYNIGREGTYAKDLSVVIRDGESLLDVILVEDDPSYTAHDQEPCMYIVDLLSWYLPDTNQERGIDHFPKNSIYYMLGLFKTYFENEKYKQIPLRVWLDQILPKDMEYYSSFFETNPFAHNILNIGLSEVQKQVPDAILYKSEEHTIEPFRSTDRLWVKFSKETTDASFVRNVIRGNIPLSMYYLAGYLFENFHSSEIVDEKQPAAFYQKCIVNLIERLNHAEDIRIHQGTKIYDVWIIPSENFGNRGMKHITSFLSFIYVPNEAKLKNTAETALQNIQSQVDIKKSERELERESERIKYGYRPNYMRIVSIGIAFSTKSFLAAYTYEECSKIHFTDTYNYTSLY